MINDVLVVVGNCLVSTDFVFVDMEEQTGKKESGHPLLLGRTFMAATNAKLILIRD